LLVANITSGGTGAKPLKTPKLARQELLIRVSRAIESGEYRILPHARQRCDERQVSPPDIETALQAGRYVP